MMTNRLGGIGDGPARKPEKGEALSRKPRDFFVGGVKMNIRDIANIADMDTVPVDLAASASSFQESLQDFRPPAKPVLVAGMSPDAHTAYSQMAQQMTKHERGVSKKKIIIPSFETTSKLFAQHFQILRQLKHKVDLLRQSQECQRSLERSWYQVD